MENDDSRERLLAKRQELIERIAAIKNDIKNGLEPDLSDQAIQLENFEVLQRLLEQATSEIEDLEKQLEKTR